MQRLMQPFMIVFAMSALLPVCPVATAQDATPEPKEIATLVGHGAVVWCIAFGQDGKTLATGGADKKIRLWDLATRKNTATLEGHTEEWITSVAFGPDDINLVSHAQDSTVRLWDLKTGKTVALLDRLDCAHSINFRNGGKTVVFGSPTSVEEWDWKKGEVKTVFKPAKLSFGGYFAFTDEGKLRALGRAPGKNNPVICRVPEEESITLAKNYVPFSTPFSPGAKMVATGANSYEACFWDCATGKLLYRVVCPGRTGQIAFSRDGQLIAVSYRVNLPGPVEEGCIVLVNAATGKEIAGIRAHRAKFANISALAFSPDGNTLASASTDHTVKLYDVSSARQPKAKGKDLKSAP